MDPTDEQLAIGDFIASGEGNLVIQALAGSGKTSSLLYALERLPQRSALLCAFNRSIADELKTRLPKMPRTHAIHVQTFHGQGLAMLKAQYRHLQIDKSATEALINKAAGQSISFKMRRAAVRLLRTLKETYAEPAIPTSPHVLALGLEYDYLTSMTDRESGLTVEVVRDAYVLSLNIMDRETIDFCDMVWAPVALNIKPKTRYLAIFVDECFPGDTPILLADGTTKTIRSIVEGKETVEVLSWDEATNQQVVKRVVDFKAVPRLKKTVRFKVQQVMYRNGQPRSLKRSRQLVGLRSLVCTADHRVFVLERGWVEAASLKPGDKVQVESSAPRDDRYNNKYKHSNAGKKKLADGLLSRDMSGGDYSHCRPPIRGGNGQATPVAQQVLFDALRAKDPAWCLEYAVPTKIKRGTGYPTSYKIDIANPACKIAIECDGPSHNNPLRREKDAKKTALLSTLGWKVLRFDNASILRDIEHVVAGIPSGCPTVAVVLECEDHEIDDSLVYDLTIEDTHCYYAHGILVHNCQDISVPQLSMVRMLMAPNSRFIAVGDKFQSIYAWRGANANRTFNILRDELNAKFLPLTMTWRCSKAVVKEANAIVPELRARDNAAPGSIIDTTRAEMPELLKQSIATDVGVHTFVLSRNNASLLDCALYLWRERVRFELNAGKELLEPLFTLLDTKLDLRDVTLFRKSLDEWKMKELARAEAAHAAAYADRIEEQAAMLMVASTFAKPDQIRKLLSDILLPNTSGVLLSTVHKVKGLEAERVFLLKQTFARHAPCRACKGEGFDGNCRLCGGTGYAEPEQEEKNIEYVAITRAKTQIVWVDMKRDDSEQRLAKAGA